jgi:uncharacterized protein
MTERGPGAGPTADAERLPALDVLRGFALLGILLVNLPFFAMPTIEDPFYAHRAFPGCDAAAR